MAIKETYRIYTLCAGMDVLFEVEYCDDHHDTRPEQLVARAIEQHVRLKHDLALRCHKVSLHICIHLYVYHPDWRDGEHLLMSY